MAKAKGGSNGREGKKKGFLEAASTATIVANVTNVSFKSSTVPLQTILLAWEPSERKSKDTAAVQVSCLRNYGPPCKVLTFLGIDVNSRKS